MTKFIAIAGSKGGIGKTTTALNLGTALTKFGKDVIVFDGDFSKPDVSLQLGAAKVPVTLHDVAKGKEDLLNSIYRHVSGIRIVPGHINADGNLSIKEINSLLKGLQGLSDVVLVDCPADVDKSKKILSAVDESLVVTTPELTSVTAALKMINLIEESGVTVLGIVLNRVAEDEYELSVDNVESFLGKPVIAIIPESVEIKRSHYLKHPVVYLDSNSKAAYGFKILAAKLAGQDYRGFPESKNKVGLFDWLLRKLGYK